MTPASPCPDNAELRAFVLGIDTEAEAAVVEGHLPACPSCLSRLDALRAADGLLLDLRSPAPADLPDVPPEEVATLIALLRGLGAATSSAQQTEPEARPGQPDGGLSSPEAFGRYRVNRV